VQRRTAGEHIDASGRSPEQLLVRGRREKNDAREQQRSDQHTAVVERRRQDAQQDQKEDATGEQPVESKAVSEASLGMPLGTDVDERNQQQVAECQRMAVERIGGEPALQTEDEIERRKQQDGKPKRRGECKGPGKSQGPPQGKRR
jgi:hypothetical protein